MPRRPKVMISGPKGHRPLYFLWLMSGIFPLTAALFFQYGMDITPCTLCLLERLPYGAVIVLALWALWRPAWGRRLYSLVLLAYGASIGLSLYHMGVEYGILESLGTCAPSPEVFTSTTPEALEASLMNASPRRCDQVYKLFDLISFSMLNMGYSLVMGAFAVLAQRQANRWRFK